jgi:hypothetical protein
MSETATTRTTASELGLSPEIEDEGLLSIPLHEMVGQGGLPPRPSPPRKRNLTVTRCRSQAPKLQDISFEYLPSRYSEDRCRLSIKYSFGNEIPWLQHRYETLYEYQKWSTRKQIQIRDQRQNRRPKFLFRAIELLTGIAFDLLRRYAKSWTASLKEQISDHREDSAPRVFGESKSESSSELLNVRQEERGKPQKLYAGPAQSNASLAK